MKRFLFVLALSFVSLCASAQTKTAYCDIYARGGGLNLDITISFDSKSYSYQGKNIGDVLNFMAADGWVLDREIVIPRHPSFSMFTRHKLHLIMKKEYQDGENPFTMFGEVTYKQKNDVLPLNSVLADDMQLDTDNVASYKVGSFIEYDGHSCYISNMDNSTVTLFINECKVGTWNEAINICQELGNEWKLPTHSEIPDVIKDNYTNSIWVSNYATKTKASSYNCMSHNVSNEEKDCKYLIMPVTTVDISTVTTVDISTLKEQ